VTTRAAPLDKQEMIRLLRSERPLSRTDRDRLAAHLAGHLPAKRGAPKKREGREPYRSQMLALRDWLNETMERERAAERAGEPFDEDKALNELVPGWTQSRRSLRVLISKKTSGPTKE
jgi:hypothetical protein